MNLCLLTSSYPHDAAGGGESAGTFIRDFALAAARAGHRVTVLTPDRGGGDAAEAEFTVHRFPWPGGGRPLVSLRPGWPGDWPLLLLPVHIVFLELVIDPSCTLIFEAEEAEPGIMRRPPRGAGEPLFSRMTVGLSVLQGLSVLAACLGVFVWSRASHGADASRALTFTTLVVSFLVIILTNRSWSRPIVAMLRVPNAAMRWVMSATAAFLALVLLLPTARGLLHFAPIHRIDLVIAVCAGLVCLMWFEALKLTKKWARIGA